MSSSIDPFFLFDHPTNIASLSFLLEPEKFEVIQVKEVIGPCNNTIAIVDILKEDLDEDDLPIIVKTGVRREVMYDREQLINGIVATLPIDPLSKIYYIEVNSDDFIDSDFVINKLRQYQLDVGDNAIEVLTIANTNVMQLKTTNKSLRFYGEAFIAFKIT